MNRKLSLLDASWLLLDSPDTPAHAGALLIFRKPEQAPAAFAQSLATRLRGAGPIAAPWNWKLRRGLGGRIRRQWVDADDADLDDHFQYQVLPPPGGERELGMLVSRLHSYPLDLRRPPWECHLIDGLHDEQFALYCKVHHALVDVPSFMKLLLGSFSANPADDSAAPFWTRGGVPERERLGAELSGALLSLANPASGLNTLREFGGAIRRLLRAGSEPALAELRPPYSAPRLAINNHIGPQRRIATQQFELARLQQAAQRAGASVDEIVLYLCASVLRRFFKEYNALPEDPLLAAIPGRLAVDARDGEPRYGALHCVSLGTQHADPDRRLQEIRGSLAAAREHLRRLAPELAPAYTLLTSAPYLLGQFAGLGPLAPNMFNLVIAAVHGPDQPRYLDGAELQAAYPMFPLIQHGALTITCMSYAGRVSFGFIGARDTLPSLQRMAVYLELALEDLEALHDG